MLRGGILLHPNSKAWELLTGSHFTTDRENTRLIHHQCIMPQCFQIALSDNIATLLADAEPGVIAVRGDAEMREIRLTQPVRMGHKIALFAIKAGVSIIKYGVPIGVATQPIAAGEWVHLHNCRSLYDMESSNLNVQTGAREETPYA